MQQPPPFPSSADPRGAAPPPGKPPARGLSGCAIAAIIGAAVLLVGVFLVAILAAIAVPAYHDYLGRSRVHEAYARAQEVQQRVDEARERLGRCPGNLDIGYGKAAVIGLGAADGEDKGSHARVAAGVLPSGNCGFELRFDRISPKIDGRTLVFESDADGWHCLAGTLEDAQRPIACRRATTSTP